MDPLLRILHIVFGVFWVGASVFVLFFLEPRLRTLGSAIESRVMRALVTYVSPAFGLSGIIILGTGVAMALRLRGGSLDTYLTTGWGFAMLVGFVATVAALVVGFGLSFPHGLRLMRLERSMEGRDPSADEARQLEEIFARIRMVERINIVLILIALVAMPIARFV